MVKAFAPDRLAQIDHIVVVMLENRSFDHMLGYLDQPRYGTPMPVDGLANAVPNRDGDASYLPEPLDELVFDHAHLDPPHHEEAVRVQMAGGAMDGFVKAFAASLAADEKHPELQARAADQETLKVVMGHLEPQQVPVFDHLARTHCVCDRWFTSVPGPTMPNRFFSVAGTCDDVMSNSILHKRFGKMHSLFRHLAPEDWSWYSTDPALLRAIDKKFRRDKGKPDHFGYFGSYTQRQRRSFLNEAADGELRRVSWIDPNFMVPKLGRIADTPGSNDDHPPSAAIHGQKLVNQIYTALGRSRHWDSCLLVVAYDEHGGFADHVPAPRGRGPRVPGLLVGPHVTPGVCSTELEAASIIKTILLRFSPDPEKALDEMPARVRDADDLSVALDGGGRAYVPVAAPGGAALGEDDLHAQFLEDPGSTLARAIEFVEKDLTDLQREIVENVAIPLRTGVRTLARVQRRGLTRILALLVRPFRRLFRPLPDRRP